MLDPNSSTPLYVQLSDQFRQMIETGELKTGDRFPAELDLVKQLGVARITVRHAIDELVQDGLLVRRQGKGTFVAAPKIERHLVDVAGFTARMRARGVQVTSRVLDSAVIAATPKLANHLAIAPGDAVLQIRRVRYTNGDPAAVETSFLALDRCPGIDQMDFSQQSLYEVLETQYGMRAATSRKTLEYTQANSLESNVLQIPAGAPLFLLAATVYTGEGVPLEFAKILLRGDRVRFQI